jgi:glycyl-tRNA synthetase
MSNMPDSQRMEKIVSLCKRRGFIFQGSEIYGGLNGVWDYGPLGVELKRNLKDYWWRVMVRERDDVVGMYGSILTHRAVLKASGHEDTFSDPMVDCLLTQKRFRADQVEAQSGVVYSFTRAESATTGWKVERPFSVLLRKGENAARAQKLARQFYAQGSSTLPDEITLFGETTGGVENSTEFNPENGAQLTPPRPFNLMFSTQMGASADPESIAYLRPETAQSIFVQFKNVLDTSRKKLPFGIAQIGKAFRNEINPRNFTFRSREFEQMELEYFCRPEQGMELLEYWKEERVKFYQNIGIPRDKLHVLTVPDADRAFYSKGTYDIEYEFPFGMQELEGVAYRTDYDLKQHQEASGKPLDYFDEETKERFIPHVVEPSAGVDRTVLALLCNAYDEETVTDEKGKSETRIVMRFHPRMAPVKVGVFPLLKNNEQLVAKARQIQAALRPHMNVFYDETGAIGRRYRRQDEAGTPFGITVDFETLGEKDPALLDTVTLRDRDSMKQERVRISDLIQLLMARVA